MTMAHAALMCGSVAPPGFKKAELTIGKGGLVIIWYWGYNKGDISTGALNPSMGYDKLYVSGSASTVTTVKASAPFYYLGEKYSDGDAPAGTPLENWTSMVRQTVTVYLTPLA